MRPRRVAGTLESCIVRRRKSFESTLPVTGASLPVDNPLKKTRQITKIIISVKARNIMSKLALCLSMNSLKNSVIVK